MAKTVKVKKIENIIVLADGSEWNGYVSVDPYKTFMWCSLSKEYSMPEVFAIFNDPDKTYVIKTITRDTLDERESREEYSGFTQLTNIQQDGINLQVRLSKPIPE